MINYNITGLTPTFKFQLVMILWKNFFFFFFAPGSADAKQGIVTVDRFYDIHSIFIIYLIKKFHIYKLLIEF
jgi:hypothetical protein